MSIIYKYTGFLKTGPDVPYLQNELYWLEEYRLKKHTNSVLKKLFLFYINDPKDPVFIKEKNSVIEIHPGKNRFLGCSMRDNPPTISATIFSENPHLTIPYLDKLELLEQFEYRNKIARYHIVPQINWDGRDKCWNDYWPNTQITVTYKDHQISEGAKNSTNKKTFRIEDFENAFYCIKHIFDNRENIIS
jgi:hypothetical protein